MIATIDHKTGISIALVIALAGVVGNYFVTRFQVETMARNQEIMQQDLSSVKVDVAYIRGQLAPIKTALSQSTIYADQDGSLASANSTHSSNVAVMDKCSALFGHGNAAQECIKTLVQRSIGRSFVNPLITN